MAERFSQKNLRVRPSSDEEKIVTRVILGRVKGGFTVDIDGATAFLPGSQVDIKPIKDFHSIMNIPKNFKFLKWIKEEVILLYQEELF